MAVDYKKVDEIVERCGLIDITRGRKKIDLVLRTYTYPETQKVESVISRIISIVKDHQVSINVDNARYIGHMFKINMTNRYPLINFIE